MDTPSPPCGRLSARRETLNALVLQLLEEVDLLAQMIAHGAGFQREGSIVIRDVPVGAGLHTSLRPPERHSDYGR